MGLIEEHFAHVRETQPEILAHHCTQAGLANQAIGYWLQAGQRAAKRLAYTEAVAYFQRGMTYAGVVSVPLLFLGLMQVTGSYAVAYAVCGCLTLWCGLVLLHRPAVQPAPGAT